MFQSHAAKMEAADKIADPGERMAAYKAIEAETDAHRELLRQRAELVASRRTQARLTRYERS